MTIFRYRKCSIILPSSCNLAGKLISAICMILPATALLSTTTNWNNRKRDRSRELIAQPTIQPLIAESTIEPTVAEPTIATPIESTITEPPIQPTIESSGTQIAAETNSLMNPESRLWH